MQVRTVTLASGGPDSRKRNINGKTYNPYSNNDDADADAATRANELDIQFFRFTSQNAKNSQSVAAAGHRTKNAKQIAQSTASCHHSRGIMLASSRHLRLLRFEEQPLLVVLACDVPEVYHSELAQCALAVDGPWL